MGNDGWIKGKTGYSLKFELEQHTGLLHFQHVQTGATLRATEVKPKLDRYIAKRYERDAGKSIPKAWKLGDTDALNYQLRLMAGSMKTEEPSNREPYFGNTGLHDDAQKKLLVYNGSVDVSVLCFIPELLAAIERYVCDFFLCTNFGTCQNKGYGSFTVRGSDVSEQTVASALREQYGAARVYRFWGGFSPLQRVSTIYKIMKSGFNFRGYRRSLLFLYMHEYFNIGNEKAWLKQNRYVPIPSGAKAHHSNGADEKPHYVRALMGIGDHYEIIQDLRWPRDKFTVNIEDKVRKKEPAHMDRLPSSVFFKVIGSDRDCQVYMVGTRIDPSVFNRTFQFNGHELMTPGIGTEGRDGRVIDENFLDGFLEYCMTALNDPKPREGNALTDFQGMKGVRIQEVRLRG